MCITVLRILSAYGSDIPILSAINFELNPSTAKHSTWFSLGVITGKRKGSSGGWSGSIFNIGKSHRLSDDDIEELICDCITICLQKIREEKYVFQGHSPATYVIEIAKNRARNFRRKALRHDTSDVEQIEYQTDEPDFRSLAQTELLEKLLSKLEPNCQNLIRLKYLEERRDKEVIEAKLTQYTTVDALKNHRSKCLKKLVEIGAAASLFNQ